MKILEAIKKGFSVTSGLKNLVVLIFILNVIFNIITTVISPEPGTTPPPQINPAVSLIVFVLTVVFVLLSIFVQGGSFSAVRDYIKSGSKTLANFVSNGKKFYFRLLGLGIILIGVIFLLTFLVIGLVLVGSATNISFLGVILALILGSVGILILFLFMLSPYVLIVEDMNIFPSIKKSIDLVRENFFKFLGIFLLAILIAFVIGLLIGVVVGLLSLLIKVVIVRQVVAAIFMSALNAFVTVFVTGSLMAYYLAIEQAGSAQKPITQAR